MTTNLLRALVLCALLTGCATRERDETPVAADATPVVANVTQVPLTGRRNLRESSGIAMSRDQTGVIYTIDDSGNQPQLFAFDTTGADRGTWLVTHATNLDWEAIATAPCGTQNCVYIGDVGDNKEIATARRIYRFAEPASATNSIRAEFLEFTYPDGAHDVEAMFVTPSADIYLVTKRPRRRGGSLRPALVYSLPASVWKNDARVEATLVDSLPIVPGAQPLMLVTDASISPDGKLLAVRTYTQAYIFRTEAATGRVDHAAKYVACDVTPLGEAQGEGITWTGSGRLAFASEGKKQPLRLATCPVP
jgi:hypothetical protein